MVVFLMCTAMTYLARRDLALTTVEARNLQRFAAAQGAANEILVRLKQGDDPALYPVEPPTVFDYPDLGLKALGWVLQDSVYPEVYHIHALVDGQHFTLTTSREQVPDAVNFAGVSQHHYNFMGITGFFIQKGDSGSWEPLPPVPTGVYTKGQGSTSPADPSYSTVSRHYAADDQGHLYAEQHSFLEGETIYRYDRSDDNWQALPPIPRVVHAGYSPTGLATSAESYIDDSGEQFGAGTGWNVSRDGSKLALPVNLSLTQQGGSIDGVSKPAGAYLCTLNIEEGSQGEWTVIPQPGYDRIDEVALGAGSEDLYTVSVADDQDRYSTTVLKGPDWTPLPPVVVGGETLPLIRDLTVGPEGEVYAVASSKNFHNPHVMKYDGQSWSVVAAPSGDWSTKLQRSSFTGLSVDSAGRLTFVESQPEPGQEETFYRQSDEGWEAMSQVPQQNDTTAWSHLGGGILESGTYSYERKASF